MSLLRRLLLAVPLASVLAACGAGIHFGPREVQGYPAMVNDAGEPRLWVLTRIEETRESRDPTRRGPSQRKLVMLHFDLQAFDPGTARPVWSQRVRSITIQDGDRGRVIGSTTRAGLLGQDGDRVWMVIGREPLALSAADGTVLDDGERLVQRHPEVAGRLPEDPQRYGFDAGLVFMAADARQFVVRGPEGRLEPYSPRPAPAVPVGHDAVKTPLPPAPDAPLRQVAFGGGLLGLYTGPEATDAATDPFGRKLAFPHTVLDQGPLARRSLWWGRLEEVQRFDERFPRVAEWTPEEGSPTFLRGRFLRQPGQEGPLPLPGDPGLLVGHNTRIDREGRLALTRLGADLGRVWTAELPLSDSPSQAHLRTRTWADAGWLLLAGELSTTEQDRVLREIHVVSVDLATGGVKAWNIQRDGPP